MYDHNDDFQDFLQEMGDVKPIKSDDRVRLDNTQQTLAKQLRREAIAANQQRLNPFTMEGVKPVDPLDYLEYKKPGIQDGVYKNLRLGKYDIEQKVSFNGLSLKDASQLLYTKLEAAHQRGVRTLLIQHGKGEQSKPFPALKKSYVKHWLPQLDIVIAFHTAQPQHGGLGATYVLLKKHPNQKMINREKQAKR